jgi:hypothetical protein
VLRLLETDAAQHEMTHCIEADRAELQGVFDSMAYFREIEGLHQLQHLNILAAAMLLEPGFEQTPQFGEAVRQLPTGERSRLVQSPRLLFEQRQIVQRIEDYCLAFIARWCRAMTSLAQAITTS